MNKHNVFATIFFCARYNILFQYCYLMRHLALVSFCSCEAYCVKLNLSRQLWFQWLESEERVCEVDDEVDDAQALEGREIKCTLLITSTWHLVRAYICYCDIGYSDTCSKQLIVYVTLFWYPNSQLTFLIQSASIARSQGLLESFCVSSSGNFLLAWLHSSCNMAHRPGELRQKLSSKPCDRAIDALCTISWHYIGSNKCKRNIWGQIWNYQLKGRGMFITRAIKNVPYLDCSVGRTGPRCWRRTRSPRRAWGCRWWRWWAWRPTASRWRSCASGRWSRTSRRSSSRSPSSTSSSSSAHSQSSPSAASPPSSSTSTRASTQTVSSFWR